MADLQTNINQARADFNAIREKIIEKGVDMPNGTPTASYAEKVEQVYDAGFETSEEGIAYLNDRLENTLYSTDTGGKSHYDAFWDLKQISKGKPTTYTADFGGRWTVEMFNPKYDIVPASAPYLFTGNNLRIDLVEHFEKIGKKLDFSQCSNQNSCFFMSNFTRLGNVSALGGYYNVFQDCKYLVTIDEWGDAQGREMTANGLHSTFTNCTALENITIKGYFANNIYFHWCTKLTRASIESIINALSKNVSGKTLQLSKTAVNNAFPDASNNEEWEALVTAHQNWTITLM